MAIFQVRRFVFSVCKVHKIARISHFNRSKGLSKNSQTNIKKSAHGRSQKECKVSQESQESHEKKRHGDTEKLL